MNNTYLAQQAQCTEEEIKRMQKHSELISINDMQALLHELGLRLNLASSNLLCYYNTLNVDPYLEATTQPVDIDGHSPYNTQSSFYQTHFNGRSEPTETGKRLQQIRLDYFTTITVKEKVYILSF